MKEVYSNEAPRHSGPRNHLHVSLSGKRDIHASSTPLLCGLCGVPQISSIRAFAQTAIAPSLFDPRETFAPLTLPGPVNAYRSSNGAPGPNFWQNEADYDLPAELDTAAKQLKATETITYTNNSPDTLPSLWVQLQR